ncbi:hypothetical protein [Neptunitalea lumnitzerae]|uniref:Uncharacterized protein n=1 Tax=Neptunitalea lumnitzerae TaxID=2965509 RepID=A0ABQ5MI47_9FLAO|nr:hypothetical protein [Neptunitalea sp. Y10]GLB49027.1 hypothetical protein Y10_13950 [Neptunitalea sp. Y10]
MRLLKLFSEKRSFFDTAPHVAFVVAKSSNGSTIGWQIAWGKGVKINTKARKNLKKKVSGKVIFQSAHEEHGHFSPRGFWVVIKSKRNLSSNSDFISYGMGADTGSYQNAEEKALLNLRHYDSDWNESHGYTISKKGVFH